MATSERQTGVALGSGLPDTGQNADTFFQLVRLAERTAWPESDQCRPVGGDGPPAHEVVRFEVVPGTGFPPRAVERVRRQRGEAPAPPRYLVHVAFMGLHGPMGALPGHYTKLVRSRLKHRDNALADFLDLFNHRLVSLFYRAWAKYRVPVQLERGDGSGVDPVTRALQAMTGQSPGAPCRDALYYGGHFSRQVRSPATLERMLADFLGCRVRVESFVGQWLHLVPSARLCIGSAGGGRNHRLGQGVLPGWRAWDTQSRVRIHVGPISVEDHESLLPGRSEFRALKELVLAYTPAHIDVDLTFEVEEAAVAQRRPLGRGLRCGRNVWLQSGPATTRYATLSLTDH